MNSTIKDLLDRSTKFTRVEFWAAITLYVFQIFFFISDAIENGYSDSNAPGKQFFDEVNAGFGLYRNYLLPLIARFTLLFLVFLSINFVLVPRLIRKEAINRNAFFILLTFLLSVALYTITSVFTKGYLFYTYSTYGEAYIVIFQRSLLYISWFFLTLFIYQALKYVSLYLLTNSEEIRAKFPIITTEALVVFVIGMMGMFLAIIAGANSEMIISLIVICFSALLIYSWSLYALIPNSLNKKRPFLSYMLKEIVIMIALFILVSIILLLVIADEEAAFGLSAFNAFFNLLITAPLSWVVFKRKMKGNEEIFYLKRELGQTHANFDFLRSQINPHFLFNALNTIYGTAIQEKAERTSEGIEKLGDMMRFMLQENMQEKIPLAREIDYVNNYISLQKLRTDPNPNVNIQTQIDASDNNEPIAPMLLIPFVENAFKHGISFRETAHISITLEMKEKTLYFDVYNSKHAKQGSDPEKDKSGIGLNNVKQRLKLLYPGKHELMIRETAKEFFVHLTIQLS